MRGGSPGHRIDYSNVVRLAGGCIAECLETLRGSRVDGLSVSICGAGHSSLSQWRLNIMSPSSFAARLQLGVLASMTSVHISQMPIVVTLRPIRERKSSSHWRADPWYTLQYTPRLNRPEIKRLLHYTKPDLCLPPCPQFSLGRE